MEPHTPIHRPQSQSDKPIIGTYGSGTGPYPRSSHLQEEIDPHVSRIGAYPRHPLSHKQTLNPKQALTLLANPKP